MICDAGKQNTDTFFPCLRSKRVFKSRVCAWCGEGARRAEEQPTNRHAQLPSAFAADPRNRHNALGVWAPWLEFLTEMRFRLSTFFSGVQKQSRASSENV